MPKELFVVFMESGDEEEIVATCDTVEEAHDNLDDLLEENETSSASFAIHRYVAKGEAIYYHDYVDISSLKHTERSCFSCYSSSVFDGGYSNVVFRDNGGKETVLCPDCFASRNKYRKKAS